MSSKLSTDHLSERLKNKVQKNRDEQRDSSLSNPCYEVLCDKSTIPMGADLYIYNGRGLITLETSKVNVWNAWDVF